MLLKKFKSLIKIPLITLLLYSLSHFFALSLIYAEGDENLSLPTSQHTAAVLLIDSSASMKLSDPQGLRYEGAKLFVQFLKAGDELAIVGFDRDATVYRPLIPYVPQDLEKINKVIDSIPSEGMYTDFYTALEKAKEVISVNTNPNFSKEIILISDGKLDPDPSIGSSALFRELLFKELLPSFKENNIKVYTLYFSEEADKDLLEKIATATDGLNWFTPKPDDLHSLFAELFLAVKKPQIVPLTTKGFSIDAQVEEATFYIDNRQQSKVYLVTPSGEELRPEKFPSNVKWFVGTKYHVITIKDPEPGLWQVGGVKEGQGFATVLTNLKLVSNWPSTLSVDKKYLLKVQLFDGPKPIILPKISKKSAIAFQIVPIDRISEPIIRDVLRDDGTSGDITPQDGIFSRWITIKEPGEYKLFLAAKTPTFERHQQILFKVLPPVIKLVLEKEGQPLSAQKEKETEDHHHQKEHKEEHKDLNKEEHNVETPAVFKIILGPQTAQLRIESLKLKAIRENSVAYILPLEPYPGQERTFYATEESLPKKGKYTLIAEIEGKTKRGRVVKAHSNSISFEKGKVTKVVKVVSETEKKKEKPVSTWPYYLLVVLGSGLISAYFVLSFSKLQKTVIFAVPEFGPLDEIEEAIESLEKKASEKEIDVNDPIFSPEYLESVKLPTEFLQDKEPKEEAEEEKREEEEEGEEAGEEEKEEVVESKEEKENKEKTKETSEEKTEEEKAEETKEKTEEKEEKPLEEKKEEPQENEQENKEQ